jgi:hypothetical protein
MWKKILFRPMTEYTNELVQIPKPGTNSVPTWYRDQRLFSNEENNWFKANKKNSDFVGTYKLCVPVVDSLTAGYMLTTSADIVVENIGSEEYIPKFFWKVESQLIDMPEGIDNKSLGNYPIPFGYVNFFARWCVDWHIKTPSGYSLWLTHPSHRHDLPFLTLNGFIDTDKNPGSLRLPFFIRDGFEGIIPSGTPIAQILPIKRDFWISKKVKYIENYYRMASNIIAQKVVRAYKNNFWSKKVYK